MSVSLHSHRPRVRSHITCTGLELRKSDRNTQDEGPETFTSTGKVTLQPDELTPATAVEFAALLRLVLERSGLTAGQIAAKTSIARSSVYNLVAPTRTGLPLKRDQVDQVTPVMQAWEALIADRRKSRCKIGATIASSPAPTRTMPLTSPARPHEADVPLPWPDETSIDTCMKQIQSAHAAGEFVMAAAWAQRLTTVLLAAHVRMSA
jgi:hypothetical protein